MEGAVFDRSTLFLFSPVRSLLWYNLRRVFITLVQSPTGFRKPPTLDGHDVVVPWYYRVTDLKKRHNALKVEILGVKAGGLLESSGVFWNPSRQTTWHTVGFTGYRST
jgi:hypothetical protein